MLIASLNAFFGLRSDEVWNLHLFDLPTHLLRLYVRLIQLPSAGRLSLPNGRTQTTTHSKQRVDVASGEHTRQETRWRTQDAVSPWSRNAVQCCCDVCGKSVSLHRRRNTPQGYISHRGGRQLPGAGEGASWRRRVALKWYKFWYIQISRVTLGQRHD